MLLKNISLILEGGGMRGMFSAGVFEAFMQRDFLFPHIAGVSAGACNILSYMSHQPGRTRRIITDFVGNDDRYCSFKNWILHQSIFGFDFILDEVPHNLLPFDYDPFYKYPGTLQIGTSDCNTGESIWYTQQTMGKDFMAVRASASLPFFAPVVKFDNRELLDGALTDPIPFDKGLENGYQKLVVVLTRNAGYRKTSTVPRPLLRLWYPHYPKLWDIMSTRAALYNEQLATVERLEREGRAIIIRPQEPLTLERLDFDKTKLLALHDHGKAYALELCDKITALNND